MAGCQGTSDDLGVSSSRWGKAQARWQADYGRTLDLAWTEGWEHRRAPDWKSEEKKRAIDIDQPNVNYKNPTRKLEDT
jgi:hypothetical protein